MLANSNPGGALRSIWTHIFAKRPRVASSVTGINLNRFLKSFPYYFEKNFTVEVLNSIGSSGKRIQSAVWVTVAKEGLNSGCFEEWDNGLLSSKVPHSKSSFVILPISQFKDGRGPGQWSQLPIGSPHFQNFLMEQKDKICFLLFRLEHCWFDPRSTLSQD